MEMYGVLITENNKCRMLDSIFETTGEANAAAKVFNEPGEVAKVVVLSQLKGCAIYKETKTRYHYATLHPSKFEESNRLRSGGYDIEFSVTDAGEYGVPQVSNN